MYSVTGPSSALGHPAAFQLATFKTSWTPSYSMVGALCSMMSAATSPNFSRTRAIW